MADLKKSSKTRNYPGVKGRRPDLKALKRKEAEERFAAWNVFTPEQQLEKLDLRKAEAKKQRSRLVMKINATKPQ